MTWTLLQILLPVFGLIVLGVYLRKINFMDEAMEKAFNKYCYWIGLPVFIFVKAAKSAPLNNEVFRTASALLLVTIGLLICSLIAAKIIRLPKRSTGTFSQASFRGNLGYVGLPVIAFAFSDSSSDIQIQANTLAILSMAPAVFVYNLLGVTVLEWDRRHEREGHPIWACIKSTIRNPLIISCFLGLAWNILAVPVPLLLEKVATPISNTAFPLALMAIGARIAVLNWKKGLAPAIAVSLVKNGAGILLALGICRLLGLEGINLLVVLVLSSCPTAVASYVLVDQLDGDRDLAASAIAVTHVGAVISLATALWIGL